MLDDPTPDQLPIDGRPFAEAVADWAAAPPTLDDLRRAAPLAEAPSPAMLASDARWLAIDERLLAAGWSVEQVLHAYVRATVGAYDAHGPGESIVLRAASRAPTEVLVASGDELLPRSRNPHKDGMLAAVVQAVLAARDAAPPRFDALVSFYRSAALVRAQLLALPAERRRACLDALFTGAANETNATWRIERALPLRDLLEPGHEQGLRALAEQVRPHVGDDWRFAAAVDRVDSGEAGVVSERGADGLTDASRRALHHWEEKAAEAERAGRLASLAESREALALVVDVPEVHTLAGWVGATDARRLEIGEAIARAGATFGLRFTGLDRPVDVPVARFEAGGVALVLVPGGSYVRGLSDGEEAVLRALAEGDSYEEVESLLDQASALRPAVEVTIGALLLGQSPTEPLSPAEASDAFAASPFRLPSEAELERAFRGGRDGQLTWDGDRKVDEDWMRAPPPHPFGLSLVGHYPEACSDVYASGYDGASTDGSPRRGPGSRVSRGGAAMVSPWQDCGEWQLLTNAVRGPLDGWEFFASWRPAIGIRPLRER